MPEDGDNSEVKRTRVGLVFLIAGISMLLWAWGSWIYRMPATTPDANGNGVSVSDEPSTSLGVLAVVPVLAALAVAIIFLVHRALAKRERPRDSATRSSDPPADSW